MPPLEAPQKRLLNFIPWSLLVLGFLGFVDTAYLAAKYFLGETPRCILFSGCDLVTTSSYSHIGPMPVSLLGLLFYLTIFVLTLAYFDRRNQKLLRYVAYLSIPAFLFTLYLVYLQLFIIHSICVYCMFSALTSTLIFAFSQYGNSFRART